MRIRIVGVLLVSAVALLALLALSTEALAAEIGDTVSMGYRGPTQGSATGYYDDDYVSGDVDYSGVRVGGGGAGLLKFQERTTETYFYAFCIELTQNATTSYQSYACVDPEDAPVNNGLYGVMGEEGRNAMDFLFGSDYFHGMDPSLSPSGWVSNDQIFGFQLAIWEIVYEYAGDANFEGLVLGVDTGKFRLSGASAAAVTYANLALADVVGGTGDATETLALTNSTYQDFILAMGVEGQDVPVVPLPPAALGGLFLLGGLAAARRRRKIHAE